MIEFNAADGFRYPRSVKANAAHTATVTFFSATDAVEVSVIPLPASVILVLPSLALRLRARRG